MYDAEGLTILTERECRELLASVPIGRIVYTDRALPAVQPVNFVMCDGEVMILTPADSKLATATQNTVVAFEIDHFNHEATAGWSVVIIGHAHLHPKEDQPPHLAITPELISGRRLPPKETP
ncbi:hypothetical protein GCM10023191_071090 [Actinoallomurus oryzae]|uniref:Pyridoxamine 5'-phosphate oxidase n=1 Tax=Actinoallomurus oryzae TaxID=502180 RepID=A0ABP8QTU4_9ACTN